MRFAADKVTKKAVIAHHSVDNAQADGQIVGEFEGIANNLPNSFT